MTYLKYQHHDGGRAAAGFRGETGDCVCRAIAIATGMPYTDVYHALAEGNAKCRRKGAHAGKRSAAHGIVTNHAWFKAYMTSIGFRWVPTMQVGSGCKVHMLASELPSNATLIVSLSKHMATVIDGVLYDTHDCSRGGDRCVYGYWIKDNGSEKSKY